MAAKGKTITLFLMDGEPSGRIKCTLKNWTGIAYKVPKTLLEKCKDIDYLKQTGVYFLFGTDENDNPAVYIGQARSRKNGEGLLLRIQEFHPSIDYWTAAVLFAATDNSLTATEVSWLENRFCNIAREANRYEVKNGNDPNPGNITEETESELEEFIDYAKIIMGALGYKVFEPYIHPDPEGESEPMLHMNYGKGNATGKRTSEGFVVCAGSTLNSDIAKSCPEKAVKYREKYADKIKNSVLGSDILFSSPSAAAAFVGGASLSGNKLWKNSEGISLGELGG